MDEFFAVRADYARTGEFYVDRAIRNLYGVRRPDRFCVDHVKDSWVGLPDGVYVDCSIGRDYARLGFCVVRRGIASIFSTTSRHPNHTDRAEAEAVKLARALYPNLVIYCDHKDLVDQRGRKFGCLHIKGWRNRAAHNASRKAHNFITRAKLDAMTPIPA